MFVALLVFAGVALALPAFVVRLPALLALVGVMRALTALTNVMCALLAIAGVLGLLAHADFEWQQILPFHM